MELFPLGDLDTIRKMQPGRKLPETYVAICIIRPLLIALTGLHEKTIVHGNITPESIFVKAKNVAYLGDFSAATMLENEHFNAGLVPVEYSPPEVVMTVPQLAKKVPANVSREVYSGRYEHYELKTDIWMIGCLAYELLVGYSPFTDSPAQMGGQAPKDYATRATDLGMNILTRDVTSLYFPASISLEARDFIQLCLFRSPAERPTADGEGRTLTKMLIFTPLFRTTSQGERQCRLQRLPQNGSSGCPYSRKPSVTSYLMYTVTKRTLPPSIPPQSSWITTGS